MEGKCNIYVPITFLVGVKTQQQLQEKLKHYKELEL